MLAGLRYVFVFLSYVPAGTSAHFWAAPRSAPADGEAQLGLGCLGGV